MGKEIRCPVCNRATTTDALAYSTVLGQFVCVSCQTNAAVAALTPATPMTPAPHPIQPTPVQTPVRTRHAHPALIVGLTLLAAIITTVAILFCRVTPSPPSETPVVLGGAPTTKPQSAATQPVRRETSKPAAVVAAIVPATKPASTQSDEDVLGMLAQALLPDQPGTGTKTPTSPPPVPPSLPPPLAPPVAKPSARSNQTPPSKAAAIPTVKDYPRGPVSDAQIGDAIQHGVDFLLSHFKDGEIEHVEGMNEPLRRGVDALCVYALATSSKAIADPRISPKSPDMVQMIEMLKSYPLEVGSDHGGPLTYSRSLRACMLATFNRPQDRPTLEDDVAWLIHDATAGGYTYDDRFAPPYVPRRPVKSKSPTSSPAIGPHAASPEGESVEPVFAEVIPPRHSAASRAAATQPAPIFTNRLAQRLRQSEPGRDEGRNAPWDNSNSQYGLLGVWAGAEVGCEVPDNYWRLAQRHWEECQLPTGEWNYAGGNDQGYFAMTLAGIASLLVTQDYLEAPLLNGRIGNSRQPYSIPLSAGLAWLDDGDNCLHIDRHPPFSLLGYNLFSMERVGLASGFKEFGGHDWFVELAEKVLPNQERDGSFDTGDTDFRSLVETAYTLLFLSRGRHPILANKLLYDGAWTNRPRDIANLTSYTSREMERPLNWQVVNITHNPTDWADAPILYISGSKPINFTDDEIAKLKTFVDNGGILFTHADLASATFNHYVIDLSKKLFPEYGPLVDLPVDHEIYKVNYPIPLPRPKLQGVSNGVRLLMIHSPTDLANAWQIRATQTRKSAYQLGANIFLYATGKEKYRNRLDTPIVPEPDNEPQRTISLARLKYAGHWNPEPGAWPRFARILQWQTGTKLDVKEIDLDQLRFEQTPIAHLTGTESFLPTDAQLTALKNFVTAGGTLLIDAAGGSGPFADAETAWLPKTLGTTTLQPLATNNPLLKHSISGTVDVPTQTLRLYALEQLGNNTTRIKSAPLGKGRIIFSGLDLCSGLVGTNTWGILGYLPEYSEVVVKNMIMTTPR